MRKIISMLSVLLLAGLLVMAQTRQITGRVTDEKGNPIPFSTINEKGTKNGVAADANGEFSINVKPGTTVLVVSSSGFDSKEVSIKGLSKVDVQLTSSVQTMNEVIVTSVASATPKEKMTVSVTKLNADRINAVPQTSLSSALTAKVAGVKTSSTGGLPGQGLDIQLRADNNLNGGSSPLILVDGVQLS
ncbi:MAG: carboxypeptidase-like regulatory domain-containing protein, partial [Bacteroidetes bacterium]|nr:carboxypeptidase-like regulatory domain-containing protein [Bacteroidota bacterium]